MDNSNKAKKWYEHWWLWAIIVVVVFVGAFKLFSSPDNNSSSNHSTHTHTVAHKSTKRHTANAFHKDFAVGNTIKLSNGVSVKVNNIRFNNGDDVNQPDNGKRYIIANVTITNHSHSSISYNELDWNFDTNGNSKTPDTVSMDGIDEMGSGDLDKGASLTKDLVGQVPVNSKGNKTTLTYQPDTLNDNKKVHILLINGK